MVLEVIELGVVDKALALQEIHEHQAIEQDRRVPAALAIVADTLDELDEFQVQAGEVAVELLGHTFHVEGVSEPLGHLHDGDIAAVVQVTEVEYDLAELAQKKIAGLSLEVKVLAWVLLAVVPLDPVPEA